MKKALVLCFSLLSATLLLAKPYTQQGIAYLYDYKTKTKSPVPNVSLTVAYAKGPAVSRADGSFTIEFQDFGAGKKLAFEKQPYSQGLTVLNKKEVDEWSTFEGKLTLIMCNKKDFDDCKQKYYEVGLQSVTQRYDREISALKKESADYQQRLQELEEERDRILDNLRNSADAMARIDQSELDAAMQKVLDLYEQGNVDEAMRKLEDMKLEEKFVQTLEKKHEGERIVAEAVEDSVLMLNKLRTSVDMYKNNGNYEKVGHLLKLLADKLCTTEELFSYAKFCNTQKKHLESINYYEKTLKLEEACQSGNEDDRSMIAQIQYNIAILYHDIHNFSKSDSLFKSSMIIRRKLAKDNPEAYMYDLAASLDGLAILYNHTNHYSESEDLFKEALKIKRRLLSDDSSQSNFYSLALTLNNLAALYHNTQRVSECEDLYKEALEIIYPLAEEDPYSYSQTTALIMENLASLLKENNRFNESETLFILVLEIHKMLAEENRAAHEPDVAKVLHQLALLYRDDQRPKESEKKFKEALDLYRKMAKESPIAYEPDLAALLNNLAALYRDSQNYSKSETYYKESLEIYKRLATSDPDTYEPNVAWSLYNLGNICVNTKKNSKAIPYYEDAAKSYYKTGKNHDYLWTLFILSFLYSDLNYIEKAYYTNKTLLSLKKDYENDELYSSHYITILGNQSYYALFMKQYAESELLATEGLKEDPSEHWIASNLAAALLFQGRLDDAMAFYRQYKDKLKDAFLNDFEQFKTAGVIPKEREEDVEKIKRMLEE